ncbi:LysR family transcriptional regulator [Pandoraea apista]|uniref:LysR family transcriptional regulator n=1 Tax=Pandoraea apista TaxID=93218 RepID=UPI00058A7E7E|nr:LysR family transcriptional regulator [Pandoraea apista]AJE99016.1 LysR family transcriptional regulator [Pandoraea apista]AKH73104.1 LysR family transcriptional regulator [Pandoraea apista]AKI61499.1 LysR family transcriptional regulator [Pandoraea apista]
MNISLRQLKAFVLVATLGNFTRAAERLHITQAGLSVMMREIETQFGSRLFDRTTRSVTLTEAGHALLPVASAAVGELDTVAVQIAAFGQAQRKTLRIAATPLVSSHLMPEWFGAFRLAHPDVDVRLHEAELAQVQGLVEQGEADLGFGFFTKASHGIERTLMQSFRLMRVSAAGKHLPRKAARRGRAESDGRTAWEALRAEVLIGLPPDNPIQQLVETHLARIGRADEPRPMFRRFETLIGMAEAGLGTAIMPTFAFPACRHRAVRCEVLTHPEVSLGFHRIVKRGRSKPELWRQFTELAMASMQRIDAMAHAR